MLRIGIAANSEQSERTHALRRAEKRSGREERLGILAGVNEWKSQAAGFSAPQMLLSACAGGTEGVVSPSSPQQELRYI